MRIGYITENLEGYPNYRKFSMITTRISGYNQIHPDKPIIIENFLPEDTVIKGVEEDKRNGVYGPLQPAENYHIFHYMAGINYKFTDYDVLRFKGGYILTVAEIMVRSGHVFSDKRLLTRDLMVSMVNWHKRHAGLKFKGTDLSEVFKFDDNGGMWFNGKYYVDNELIL